MLLIQFHSGIYNGTLHAKGRKLLNPWLCPKIIRYHSTPYLERRLRAVCSKLRSPCHLEGLDSWRSRIGRPFLAPGLVHCRHSSWLSTELMRLGQVPDPSSPLEIREVRGAAKTPKGVLSKAKGTPFEILYEWHLIFERERLGLK